LKSKKPISKKNLIIQKIDKPYLENETRKSINQIKEKTNPKITKGIKKSNSTFLYPSKKPLTYTAVLNKTVAKSKILKEKDYNLAKNIFSLIKKSKWNSALEQTKKIKDKEFKNLVTWLYLKERGNQAT
jgi:hypothetical protein